MPTRHKVHRDPPTHLSADERARFLDLDGEPLCERVALGNHRLARDEAERRLRSGDLDGALLWIERAEPRLSGLAAALSRSSALSFGPPAAQRGRKGALERAVDWFARGDLVETVAQLEAFGGFHGLGRRLTAHFGA